MSNSYDLPPVLGIREAAKYIGRTTKAMYCLRDRRTGPASFKAGGRVVYRVAALDAWLAAYEAKDSRSNSELDPTRLAPEPRRSTRRQPLAA
ncbi:helix-turn-helix domain-containing protein [Kitasatospora sp. P5_F3]|jgi:predicted DNA-binding transcriptional regulator AlpA